MLGLTADACGVTLLADVVRTSARSARTPSRLAKVAALAERLRSLEPEEVDDRASLPQRRAAARASSLWAIAR